MVEVVPGRTNPEQQSAVRAVAFVALCLGWWVALGRAHAFDHGTPTFLKGAAAAVLPLLLYLPLSLLVDRYEKEPWWMLALAFLLGAVVVFLLVTEFNPETGITPGMSSDCKAALRKIASIKGARVEELIKVAALFLLFLLNQREFDNTVDGILYGTMLGLGFAMSENVVRYVAALPHGDISSLLYNRAMRSPFSHPLFAAVTGVGLGATRYIRNPLLKAVVPLVCAAVAVTMHVEWNRHANLLVMIVPFFMMVELVVLEQWRERKLIFQNLKHDIRRRRLTADDLRMLCRFGGRARALIAAFRTGGFAMLGCEERFHQAATKLAFHRWRTNREPPSDPGVALGRERELVHKLADAREARLRMAVGRISVGTRPATG